MDGKFALFEILNSSLAGCINDDPGEVSALRVEDGDSPTDGH